MTCGYSARLLAGATDGFVADIIEPDVGGDQCDSFVPSQHDAVPLGSTQRSMDENEYEEFLKWEYTMAGQSVAVWAAAGDSLLRSADLLWKRASASMQLWAEGFATDEHGLPIATGRRLVGEETEIFGDREVDRSAVLLLGFAIENMSKSILIGRKPGLVSEEGMYRGPDHHDLVMLVLECGLDLSEKQRASLVALTDYTEWLGRYPIPKAYTKGRSTRGAWVWHRTTPRHEIWSQCRPVAHLLRSLREE